MLPSGLVDASLTSVVLLVDARRGDRRARAESEQARQERRGCRRRRGRQAGHLTAQPPISRETAPGLRFYTGTGIICKCAWHVHLLINM